ncbi:MAG: SsrA-binding protein, partial [Verrucomicrobiaceae bacterium]|nr:SsrA-binding protein [Verrucomicrobiaceae bacterium]
MFPVSRDTFPDQDGGNNQYPEALKTPAPGKPAPTIEIATNRKAPRDFHILETYEAGVELRGTEVKSIRLGKL